MKPDRTPAPAGNNPEADEEDDAEPMAPPTPAAFGAAHAHELPSTGISGRHRRASVRRTSQSHRLMRTVLERLRDFDIDEVRALRDRNLPAAGRSGESARRSAAPPPPKPPET